MKAASGALSNDRSRILLAAALLVSLHVIWQAWLVAAAPYPARYDYDEGVYAETAVAAAAGARLYATVFLSQTPLLIGMLAHAFRIFGRSLVAARGVSVAFSVLWLASLAVIAARGGRPRAAVWTLAIAASAPAFVMASHTVQMEGPSEALAAFAVAVGVTGSRRTGWGDGMRWGAAGLAVGLAAMTKFTALTSLVPLAVTIAVADRPISLNKIAGRGAALTAGALLGAAAVIGWTGSPPGEMWRQAVIFHGAVARMTAADPGRTASLLLDFAAANWFVAALGLAGLAFTIARRNVAARESAIAAWLAADVAAIFLWRPVWPHHFVLLLAPLAVLAAGAAEAVSRAATSAPAREPAPRLAAAALLVAWLAALPGVVAAAVPGDSESLRAAVIRAEQSVPAGGWIVADDPIVAFLAGRGVPPTLCDTSEARMRAGWLTAADLTAALGDPRVRGVVLWRGTFRRMVPEFARDASNEFPRRWTAGDDRWILAR
jgi:4-amino-4-deoxy-L-arabinose transferase-like glycosyltransferase